MSEKPPAYIPCTAGGNAFTDCLVRRSGSFMELVGHAAMKFDAAEIKLLVAEAQKILAEIEPDWYYSQVPNTREVGWYATLFCWDSNEGIFAAGNRWLGDRWEDKYPVYAWAGPFSTMAEADEWARAHNPEDV